VPSGKLTFQQFVNAATLKPEKLSDLNEHDLSQLVKEGHETAWEELVRRYYNPLFGFILNMVRNESTAEELLQDILVNFWEKREKININTSLKAYLFRASRNHTLNFLKRKNFEHNYQQSLVHTTSWQSDETEKSVQYKELSEKLNELIESLPEPAREAFKLSRFEDMTYKEIAETMDLPVRTVHYQIGLALKQLRDNLDNFYSSAKLHSGIYLLMALLFM